MNKPDFILIGASKAGTSSICSMLAQHPEISFLKHLEPNFFSVHYEKGWSWYEKRFPRQSDNEGTLVGEKSPTYSNIDVFPDTARRIKNNLPKVKLLYVVRDPLTRIESRWLQSRASGDRNLSADFNRDVQRGCSHIIDTTDYWKQIQPYRDLFPEERIRIIFFEDFTRKSRIEIQSILRFLGVSELADQQFDPLWRNPGMGKLQDGRILQAARRLLPRDTRNLRIPKVLRRHVRKAFKTKITERPRWHDATRRMVSDRLSENTATFLEYYGKPRDFWRL